MQNKYDFKKWVKCVILLLKGDAKNGVGDTGYGANVGASGFDCTVIESSRNKCGEKESDVDLRIHINDLRRRCFRITSICTSMG